MSRKLLTSGGPDFGLSAARTESTYSRTNRGAGQDVSTIMQLKSTDTRWTIIDLGQLEAIVFEHLCDRRT